MATSTTVHVACRAAEDRTRNSNKPTKAARPRPKARIAALTSCGTRSIGILVVLSAILTSGQFSREMSQLLLIQKLAIDHSYNQLLNRTTAEPVNDVLNRSYSQVPRWFGNPIYIRATLHMMVDIALILQALENGPRGRVLHGMALRQGFAHILSGALSALPQCIHH